METNKKCCEKCKYIGLPEAWARPHADCPCHHPQEEKEWVSRFEDTFSNHGFIPSEKEIFKAFIAAEKHLSYQAGLKFAIDFIASREGWEDTKDFYLKALTSELDKEVN